MVTPFRSSPVLIMLGVGSWVGTMPGVAAERAAQGRTDRGSVGMRRPF